VLSFPIPLRVLLAPVLQIIHRVISTFLIQSAGLKRAQAVIGAVTHVTTLCQRAGLHAEGAAHQRKNGHLCRYLTRPAIANDKPYTQPCRAGGAHGLRHPIETGRPTW